MTHRTLVARAAVALLTLSLFQGCAPAEEEGLSMAVRPLRGAFSNSTDTIPGCEDDKSCIVRSVYLDPEQAAPDQFVDATDDRSTLRYYAPFDWDRFWNERGTGVRANVGVLSPSRLPASPTAVSPDETLHVTLMLGPLAVSPQALAHVGPIRLPLGYRARFEVALYPVFKPSARGPDAFEVTDIVRCEDPARSDLADPPDTFAAAVATLDDGRVLVAGGFRILAPADCPPWADAGTTASALCAEAEATDRAWIFDPTSGCFLSPRGGSMQRKRGGARATLLPDGSVVVTGGAERALVVQQVDADRNVAVTWLLPERDGPNDAAMGSFEVFRPHEAVDPEDPFRDGVPARGGFVGMGTLAQPRFLHAATPIPDRARLGVVLAGGTESPATLEVLDMRRPGGPGPVPTPVTAPDASSDGIHRFTVPRFLPTAFVLQRDTTRYVVVAGGFLPRDEREERRLADIFELDTSNNETIRLNPVAGAQDAFDAFLTSTAGGSAARFAFLAPASAAGILPVGPPSAAPASGFVSTGFVFGGLGTPCVEGPGTLVVSSSGWNLVPEVTNAPDASLSAFLETAGPGLFGRRGLCPPALQIGAPAWSITLLDTEDPPIGLLAMSTDLPVHAQGTALAMDSGRIVLFGGPRTSRDTPTAPDRREVVTLLAPVRTGEEDAVDVEFMPAGASPRLGTSREGAAYTAAAPITPGGMLLLPGVRRTSTGDRLEVAGVPGVLHVEPRCYDLSNRDEYCN